MVGGGTTPLATFSVFPEFFFVEICGNQIAGGVIGDNLILILAAQSVGIIGANGGWISDFVWGSII